MKISTEIPPIYETLKERFGVSWEKGIAIAYGDTVYSINPVRDDLIAHEATHLKQQAEIGVELWWQRYLDDPQFRLEQEIEAYKNQVQWLRANVKDREARFRKIRSLQIDLASPMYGNLIDLATASRILHV